MTQPSTLVRLSPHIYNEFSKQFRALQVNEQTTALQIAYQNGVEAVLKKLREQLVVDGTAV